MSPESSSQGLQGVSEKVVYSIGIVVSLLHIYFNVFAVLPTLTQNSLHYAGFAILCALIYPLFKSVRKERHPVEFIVSICFGVTAAFCAIYLISMEDAIYARGVHLSTAEWIAGVILILSAIEFTRRTTGLIIPILIILALTYVGWWGSMVGGVFKFSGLTPETILFRSIYGDDGIFGTIARISSTFVFMFILFGAFLLRSGAGDFVINLARAVAGRFVGGPGLVAVFASGLTGTISGSAVANTASTGVITIPLMKKAGFEPKFAAGVEAAASTGGQLMPPIMGAGAFVMASITQISYTTIVVYSILPAVLYFATVGFFVRVEAKRTNINALEDESLRVLEVIKTGGLPFLLPVSVLIGLLIYGFTPTYAAGISIVAVVVSSWLTPNKMGIRAILDALALGARNMVMTAVLLCSVGLVVNVIATAGIGNTFSLMITNWSGNSLLIAIVLVGLASLVLGMGLPVTAAYIVLGTLSAPALYNLIVDGQIVQMFSTGAISEEIKAVLMLAVPDKIEMLGQPMSIDAAQVLLAAIPPDLAGTLRDLSLSPDQATFSLLSAHMIIFWLSQDSNVTPPVCLAAFTGAAIAGTPPMATGLRSWKIAKGLYIVPLLFAYTPLLGGTWPQIFTIFLFALGGLYAFTCALQGYMEHPVSIPLRVLLLAVAFLLLNPSTTLIQMAAFTCLIGLLIYSLTRSAKSNGGRRENLSPAK